MTEANLAFKNRRFEDAYEMYGHALRIDESNVAMTTKVDAHITARTRTHTQGAHTRSTRACRSYVCSDMA